MILIWNPITQIFHFSWVLDPTRGFKPTRKTQATKSHLIIFPVLPFQWRLIAVDWLGFLPWVPNAARWLWGHLQRWIPNKPLKKTRKRVRRGSAWGFFVFFRRWFSGKEWNNWKTPAFRKKQKKRMRKKMLCAQIPFFFKVWVLRYWCCSVCSCKSTAGGPGGGPYDHFSVTKEENSAKADAQAALQASGIEIAWTRK